MTKYLLALACVLPLLAGCGQPLRLDAARATRTPLVTMTARPAPGATATIPAVTRPALPAASATATTPPVTATPSPVVQIVPETARPLTSEERWRAEQLDREVLDPPRLYRATRRVTLFWYDPATGQALEIGTLMGDFPVQARFRLRASGAAALEVPYRINNDFGLTAISEAVRLRMEAAGYTISVEAFLLESDAIQAP